MSRPKPKRCKTYKPKPVQVDPVAWGVAGAHKLPRKTIDACMIVANEAFETLKRGQQRPEDWNHVSAALTIAEVLADMQIGSNLMPQISKGRHALHKIAERMIGGDKACKAPELAAITEAIVMYGAQLHSCTQGEISRAAERAKRLIECGARAEDERLYEAMPA